MSDFLSTLTGFQEENLSLDDLLTVTEHLITRDGVNHNVILTELSEEHSKNPFPSKILATIKLRIHLASAVDENHGTTADLDDTYNDDDTIIDHTAENESIDGQDKGKPTSEHEDYTSKTNNAEPIANRLVTRILHRLVTKILPPKPDDNLVICNGLALNGRYELVHHIGTGGMGSVYKAIDREKLKAGFSDPHVAVKILNHKFSVHQNQFSKTQQEAKRCQKLTHPNIVEVYGCEHDGQMAYLVMEYLSGDTLKDKIRFHGFEGLDIEKAKPIIREMGQALSFAHEQGIVHYDFKPSNVFFTDDGQIKIIDFGIARTIHTEDGTDQSFSNKKAMTPVYASAEMLEHLSPDPKDDIFALAITSYELLTGKHPFKRIRATEARDGGMRPIQPKGMSQPHWEAFERALAFERDRRTPEVSQFLKDIGATKETQSRVFTLNNGIAASIVLILFGIGLYLNSEKKMLQHLPDPPMLSIQSELKQKPQEFSEFAKIGTVHNKLPVQPIPIDNSLEIHKQTKTEEIVDLPPSSLFKSTSAGDIESVKASLASKISSNSLVPSSGQTALILAAQARHIDTIQVLLQAQADINHQDHQGRTALIWAVDLGHSEAVELLLDHYADKNLRDVTGETALMRAAWKGHSHIVYALLDKDTDVNSRYPDGLTLLSAAAINGYTNIAKALLDAGADPNLTTQLGRTPLMAAAWNGHADMVQLLVTHGSSLDIVSTDGWTALMNAAWGGNEKIVRRLVMAGANTRIRGRNGATAAQVAKTQGHIEIAEFLESKIKDKPQTNNQSLTHLLHSHDSR